MRQAAFFLQPASLASGAMMAVSVWPPQQQPHLQQPQQPLPQQLYAARLPMARAMPAVDFGKPAGPVLAVVLPDTSRGSGSSSSGNRNADAVVAATAATSAATLVLNNARNALVHTIDTDVVRTERAVSARACHAWSRASECDGVSDGRVHVKCARKRV